MNRIETVIRRIEEALGQGRAAFEKDILEAYSRDETSDLSAMPDVLVRAESTAEVSAVLRICNEEMVPVVPRGAGSGVTGGAVPVNGGVVLSLERMNASSRSTARTWWRWSARRNHRRHTEGCARGGAMYPPGEPRAMLDRRQRGRDRRGRARSNTDDKRLCTGAEFVRRREFISTGGKFVKNATLQPAGIILAEGTLAVITKIYLRLIPAPRHSLDLLAPFGSLEEAMEAVYRILLSKTVPAAVEFMEEDAIRLVAGFHRRDIPFPEARAHLLIQIDGDSEESLHRDIEKIAVAIGLPGEEIIVAAGGPQRERLWKARRAIREAITAESPVFLAEDCVVPRSRIPAFLAGLKELFNARGLRSIMFGHAGDGNVHVDVLKGDMDYEVWKELVPGLRREIYLRAIGLGGTITGEHGIGCLRRGYLPLAASSAEIDLMKRIKKAFDPNGIINPGKIIP